jgi:hypothetical protein
MSTLRCLALVILGSLLVATPALACQPCLTKSPIERSVEQASVIALIINRDRNSSNNLYSGPDVVELTIEKLFKGDPDTYSVLVRSWYGQCGYGIHLPLKGRAVVLLQEMTDINTGEFDGTYKLVEGGCSEGQLEVKGDRVRVNEKWISLSAFESQYISKSYGF